MNEVLEKIQKIGIVPVVVLNDAKDAKPLAKALVSGGLACAEVTFRTDAAAESIRIMTDNFPEMLVGAGTVLTTQQVDKAVEAGAKFIVSPGLNPKIVKYCQEKGIPITPGTANPSDIEAALELGLDVVKFFPAEAAGGLKMIKAMSAPYVNMKFMPTGGINADNLNSYLDFPKVIACGGSWMVNSKLVAEGKFDEIENLTREAVNKMLGFELTHVGINCADESEAHTVANRFDSIFGFSANEHKKCVFAGKEVEALKVPYHGEKGHIAIGTNYIDRAVNYLKSQGIRFKEGSEVYNEKGEFTAIYLEEEIGGFAVHLVQK